MTNVSMRDLILRASVGVGAKTRLVRLLEIAEWRNSTFHGPFPRLSEPARIYVTKVWPAKLLSLPKFGRGCLRAFEAVIAEADLSMVPTDDDTVDHTVSRFLDKLGTLGGARSIILLEEEHAAILLMLKRSRALLE